ncbi:helix-turn-helix domain-containing protein [Sporomusa sphaeroides]|uniref:Helix-turn-helix domain protein n=1 Tax=Sporomusa sphaeroides DSM 2875 TaxID=1337886 RepID=A0A1U7M9T5_9FIRM|nr:helix-turn-helix transcriptional regulator [Sporomusa sphaeroides]OLS54309.1 helix-turn-helix domain protein [Sporomusa sphaeroides DSM 2875]CVK21539.1 Helix-turn-helix domain protein [Sporomusa sphaeroides DSM 2875]
MNYGQQLRKILKIKNRTPNSLATKIQCAPSTIYKILGENSKPSLDLLEKICAELKITMAEFFTIEQNEEDILIQEDSEDLPEEAKQALQEFEEFLRLKFKK